MDENIGVLGYNIMSERFGIIIRSVFDYEFHCGDVFDICINNTWITTSIEMDVSGNWYLTGIKIPIGVLVGNKVRFS